MKILDIKLGLLEPRAYSKYNSIDDKIDDLHYYTRYIKFGIGRATSDSAQEIRNNHISREEAKLLVKRFDGEFPKRYFKEIMNYLEIDENNFLKLVTNLDRLIFGNILKESGN